MRRPQEDLGGCGLGWRAWAEPLMSSWGWGKWQEGGGAVPCGVSTDCTSLLTNEHLDHFQTPVTVTEETIIARLLLSQFHRVCFQQWSTKFCFIHSTLRSSTHPASHLFMHPSTHPSIHPFTLNSPIHPHSHSSTDLIISDPKEDRHLLHSSQEDTQRE